jgi:F-box interacting protein
MEEEGIHHHDGLPASSSAAAEVGENEDLMTQILIRLPVRLLITFKSVSKHWSSLISDPQFSHHHTLTQNPTSTTPSGVFFYDSITKGTDLDYVSLQHVPENTSTSDPPVRAWPLTFYHTPSGSKIKMHIDSFRDSRFNTPSLNSFRDSRFNTPSLTGITFMHSVENFTDHSSTAASVRYPSFSFLDLAVSGARVEILQSVSGLFLCRFRSDKYLVCNPTTRKYTVIPRPVLMEEEKVVHFVLAFEPSESPHYKIVCVKSSTHFTQDNGDLGVCQIDIYSSENKTWRSTSCRFNGSDYIQPDKTAVYWKGIVHFVNNDLMGYQSFDFDIKEERFCGPNAMQYTPHMYPNTPLRYLGECRGYLHALYVRTPSSKIIRVFERDRETLKWVLKYRLHLNSIFPAFPKIIYENGPWAQANCGMEYAYSVLYIYRAENDVDSAMVLSIPDMVISYNFYHKSVKILRELPARDIDTSHHKYVSGFHFIETLAVA